MGFSKFDKYDDPDGSDWWKKGKEDSGEDEEIPSEITPSSWAQNEEDQRVTHITDLIEDDFIKAFNMIALKTLWDFVFSAIGMNDVETKRLIDSITDASSDQVIKQYKKSFGDQMDDQTAGMIALAKKRAESSFRNLYKGPIVQPGLLTWLRKKFRKGIKS